MKVNKIKRYHLNKVKNLYLNLEGEEFAMDIKKTLDGWGEANTDIKNYLSVEDIVSEDLVDYFLNILPPANFKGGYLQVGEVMDHISDSNGKLHATYLTFAKIDGEWKYKGECFFNQTEDKSRC